MVTLKSVAEELGVSLSLVSKVLNGRMGTTNVTPAKVELIKAKAKEMGYVKNSSAVALLSGKQDSIGTFLHCSGVTGSGIMENLLMGISASTYRHHKRQSLCFYGSKEEFLGLAKYASRGRMDGLLVGNITQFVSCEKLLEIQNNGLPIVTMYDRPLHPEITNVGISQVRVGEVGTKHLIEQGCRNIVNINNMDDRLEGYKLALKKAGIKYSKGNVFFVNEHFADNGYGSHVGEQAVKYFMENGVKFDGVVTQSDRETVGAINYLTKIELRVPEDVKVIGVDNSPYCEFMPIPLSSVEQNPGVQGGVATDLLMQKIDKQNVSSVLIEPTLVVRESSGGNQD
ncbi:MAG: LacI family DNA-binding transcriptional regulator [Kiritimatiellae bacterium]|jgi:LacI family transcriptional regulator|nr:LacI family DNA-binding transcriptional regulator [Kiritimatiellia bacterium]